MAARSLLILAVLLAATLAGCTSHARPDQPESKPLASPQQVVRPATLLRVLVITDEFLPVAGAQVSVVGLGLNVTTDDGGNGYFQIGAPGRYAVHVHHSRFYPNVTKVSVDGAPKLVARITLRDAPHDAHLADFYEYQGFCGPSLYVPDATSTDCQENPFFGRPMPRWYLGEGLTHAYLELFWRDQPAGSAAMRLEVRFPEAGAFADGSPSLVAQGRSPVRLTIPSELVTPAMKNNGNPIEIRVGLAPSLAPAALNAYQEFTLDAEFDYYLPAPNVDTDA